MYDVCVFLYMYSLMHFSVWVQAVCVFKHATPTYIDVYVCPAEIRGGGV